MSKASEQRRAEALCHRVLLMVHELHLLGLQQLRICPSIAPSGLAWRCGVTPVSNTLKSHGARMASWSTLAAHYTSGDGDHYFGWDDGPGQGARALARKFIERFPDIAEGGRGRDWSYAGWLVEVLYLSGGRDLPYALSDWDTPNDHIPSVHGTIRFPLPPPGDSPVEVPGY